MAIVISDLHIKSKEPFYGAIKQFLNHLADTFPNDEVIQLGDLFDTSTIHANVLSEVIGILKRFKKIHIISGNHDQSRRSGNILKPFNHYENVMIYEEKTEVEIEGHKCLMLPYIHNAKEEYEKIEWKGNFMFGHFTNEEDAFGNDGVNTDKIKAYQMFGHTHTNHIISKTKVVVGVQIPTRNLEISNSYYEITEDSIINELCPPDYFEYQTIEYGKFPENKNNILNIINCPSMQSVWEMYKDYHVRREGIELLRTEAEENNDAIDFESGNIVEKFSLYSKDKKLSKEIIDCATRYLAEVV